MDKRVKYNLKQKLATVRSIKAGRQSCTTAARKIGSKKNTVERWYRLYLQHGIEGLRVRNGSYDGPFKLQVVRYMLKKNLSLTQTAVYFKIPQEYTVSQWLNSYERCGSVGLLGQTRGRKKSAMTKKTRTKAIVTSELATEKMVALQKEVEYLRAENAFLKKLEALIQQEKAAKAPSRRQKPSRN
jgi:transposase